MSDVLKARMRQWVRDSIGAATPDTLRHAAHVLDYLSDNITISGTYYTTAESLRMLAEQNERNAAQTSTLLDNALKRAEGAEKSYRTLGESHRELLDQLEQRDGDVTDLKKRLGNQADTITQQAREIASLTRKLTRAGKKYDAIGRVVVSVLEQVQEHEDVELQFVYGEFGNAGIDAEVASDLGVGCVLGKEQRTEGDVLSNARR